MLVYEKDNKLNISFENNIENPDFEISKTEVNLGDANIVSGSSSGKGTFVINFIDGNDEHTLISDKTMREIREAVQSSVILFKYRKEDSQVFTPAAYLIDNEADHIYFLSSSLISGLGVYAEYSENNTTWHLNSEK